MSKFIHDCKDRKNNILSNNFKVLSKFLKRCCTLLLIMGFFKPGNTFWPASYQINLNDRKTFIITVGEDDNEEDEENENEMMQPEDIAKVVDLDKDEGRYKALHSHVENFNRRAIEAEMADIEYKKNHFVTSYSKMKRKTTSRKESSAKNSRSMDRIKDRLKREDDEEDVLKLTENPGDDLVESLNLRNDSLEHDGNGEENSWNLQDISSTMHPMEEYEDENTSISEEPVTLQDHKNSEKNYMDKKPTNSFGKTISSEFDEHTEEAYDYDSLRSEWEQQIIDAQKSNSSYNDTNDNVPEETPIDALKKIVDFEKPRNCTAEELTKFGVKAFECLIFDYQNAKNQTDVRQILGRTWRVVKIWICIYVCIAVPAWCQKGWCCCCFRCSMCFPRTRITVAKHYFANNEPGIFLEQPTKKGAKPETVKYKPTLFEIDAYEKFESAIRNL